MILGLLGGIGSGKSTVTRMLVEEGASAIDADVLAHEALELPEARETLRSWWGDDVFRADGSVDRAAIARRVFGDREQLARLESLIHPEVRRRLREAVESHRAKLAEGAPNAPQVLVLDVPLLAESDELRELCDHRIFVEASEDARKGRTRSRGWSESDHERREAAQLDLEAKRRAADHVIRNDGSLEETREQVRALWTRVVTPSVAQTRPSPAGGGGSSSEARPSSPLSG